MYCYFFSLNYKLEDLKEEYIDLIDSYELRNHYKEFIEESKNKNIVQASYILNEFEQNYKHLLDKGIRLTINGKSKIYYSTFVSI